MSLSSIFNVAGSGMSAESIRLNTTASNIANANTAASSPQTAYRARKPIFAAIAQQSMNGGGSDFADPFGNQPPSVGVQVKGIVQSDENLQKRFEPNNPMANKQGYVYYSNVNVVEEMADMISASRNFQTDADVMNTAKTMMQRVLTLGQ